MTERERLLAVLEGRTPDRTPWYADLSWWRLARETDGTLAPRYQGDAGYLTMHREAGAGIYLFAPMQWHESHDGTVAGTTTTSAANPLDVVTTIETPFGVLRSVSRRLPESATSAYVEHFVKGPADLLAVRHFFEHRAFEADYTGWAATDERWGDDGLAFVLSPICTSGLQTLITRWAGIETVARLAADCPDELARTVGAMEEADDGIFRILCDGPGRVVEFPENLSGEVTGGRLMRRYAMPCWRRRIAQLHGAGKKVGIHNDGTLRQSLPLLVEAGFDFIESVTPAPVGDMTMEEMRAVVGADVVLIGGVPGAMLSPLTDDATFDAFVRDVLRSCPVGTAFVLAVADQAPPDARFERIARVREIVDRDG
jgi:hypothetical protein